MTGRVVHFEIPFDDGERARGFYKELFGWQLMEMPEMGYTMVMSGPSGDSGPTEPGFINGGMLSREQAATRGPVLVVDVDSIEDSLTRIGELVATGWPVLVALSNKDFVGETLDVPLEERLTGTLAATAVSAWLGARVFRAHDVAATRQTLDMVASIRGDRPPVRTVRGLA